MEKLNLNNESLSEGSERSFGGKELLNIDNISNQIKRLNLKESLTSNPAFLGIVERSVPGCDPYDVEQNITENSINIETRGMRGSDTEKMNLRIVKTPIEGDLEINTYTEGNNGREQTYRETKLKSYKNGVCEVTKKTESWEKSDDDPVRKSLYEETDTTKYTEDGIAEDRFIQYSDAGSKKPINIRLTLNKNGGMNAHIYDGNNNISRDFEGIPNQGEYGDSILETGKGWAHLDWDVYKDYETTQHPNL